MPSVQPCEVPPGSLLRRYKDGDGFADCYVIEVRGAVSQQAFIEAFYTSRLFKIERMLLGLLASKPATDADANRLAEGKASNFSAWRVEGQSPSELLLADFTGRTRSWLMAAPGVGPAKGSSTLLRFGSAVIPRPAKGSAKPRMGWLFHALTGFHRVYSRLLLSAATRRLQRA